MAVTVNIPIENAITDGSLNPVTSNAVYDSLALKQDTLVSGTNIKTVGGVSILGPGDIAVSSGITIGTTAITSGTNTRLLYQSGGVVSQSANFVFDASNQLVIGGHTGGARLDVKAGGALSTDLAQKWTSSAGAQLGKFTGDGAFTLGTYTNPSTKLSISNGASIGAYIGGLKGVYAIGNASGTAYGVDALGRSTASGGISYGVYGIADGGTGNAINYGVRGQASGAGLTNYALYGDALSGTNNYGLYIQRGDIQLGSTAGYKIGVFAATPIVQPTTAIAASTFVANTTANILYNESTFDGYTMAQVVKALRNLGWLA
jgi:hypothetical protein